MPEDALNAKRMNVNPGGKQPLMRSGWIRKGPLKIVQHMVFTAGPNKGIAKGLREVCRERFGDQRVAGNDDFGSFLILYISVTTYLYHHHHLLKWLALKTNSKMNHH